MTIRAVSSLRGYWRARLFGRPCAALSGRARLFSEPFRPIRCNGRGLNISLRLQAREVFHNAPASAPNLKPIT